MPLAQLYTRRTKTMETFADIFKRIYSHPDIVLSTGAVVRHRPYLSHGLPNGATDAYIVENGKERPFTEPEHLEYGNARLCAFENIKTIERV